MSHCLVSFTTFSCQRSILGSLGLIHRMRSHIECACNVLISQLYMHSSSFFFLWQVVDQINLQKTSLTIHNLRPFLQVDYRSVLLRNRSFGILPGTVVIQLNQYTVSILQDNSNLVWLGYSIQAILVLLVIFSHSICINNIILSTSIIALLLIDIRFSLGSTIAHMVSTKGYKDKDKQQCEYT